MRTLITESASWLSVTQGSEVMVMSMDNVIIALVGFLGGLVALITPIIRLNSNITRLTTVVERLELLVKEKTDKLDERVTQHGKEIDEIRLKQQDHDTRLKQLEK